MAERRRGILMGIGNWKPGTGDGTPGRGKMRNGDAIGYRRMLARTTFCTSSSSTATVYITSPRNLSHSSRASGPRKLGLPAGDVDGVDRRIRRRDSTHARLAPARRRTDVDRVVDATARIDHPSPDEAVARDGNDVLSKKRPIRREQRKTRVRRVVDPDRSVRRLLQSVNVCESDSPVPKRSSSTNRHGACAAAVPATSVFQSVTTSLRTPRSGRQPTELGIRPEALMGWQ
jgi:hypothetical protein